MVSRRTVRSPVLILDLDGTVLSVNSYPRWARRLARGAFPHLSGFRRFRVAASAAAVLATRRLQLIGHDRTKWRLQTLWLAATRDDGGASEANLRGELLAFVRPEFQPILAAVREGAIDAVLATAAAEEYARGLGQALGFSYILANRRPPTPRAASSSGQRKCQSVIDFLFAQGWQDRPRILFTDHPDDLPLMRMCQTVYWFGTDDHRRLCEGAAPVAAFHSPQGEPFASMLRNIRGVSAEQDASADRSRRISR